ncbi:MAG: hypothetical protein IIB19_00415 [Chloroflexi bacterium]|nr:hypothetical protein [Chloroflexota bacterium]
MPSGANGARHRIEFTVDPIRQEPVIKHDVEPANRKNGTEIRMKWPDSACSILTDAKDRFLQIADDYTWLNPHLRLVTDWFGDQRTIEPTDPAWAKWGPSDPTSAHWYTPQHLERLIAGYIAHDQDNGRERTVRELVSEFRGLSGSAKQKKVLDVTGLHRAPLSDLVTETGCTVLLVNHNRKNVTDRFAPPELADISQSGFAEWARQWLMVGPRREWDETTGSHWLHLIAGGSAGHADSWAVDVVEGHHADAGGRRWEVDVSRAKDAKVAAQSAHERAKAKVDAGTLDRDRLAIVTVMQRITGQRETKNVIKDRVGRRSQAFSRAFASLIEDDTIEPCVVKKNNRGWEAFQLTNGSTT